MTDSQIYDADGIDLAELLIRLHANTRPVGLGFLHELRRNLTKEEAQRVIDEQSRGGELSLDYVAGRPIKIYISKNKIHGGWIYDQDIPLGAKTCGEIIEELRNGKTK